jgi:hypothetical protein
VGVIRARGKNGGLAEWHYLSKAGRKCAERRKMRP